MPEMTIGRVAGAAGVGVETVRFYERSRLITRPLRPAAGGFRVYDGETVARIRFIREAQRLGFSLGEIRELLSLKARPGADCRAVRAQAVTKRDEVDQKIGQLRQMRMALDELIASCRGRGALRECSILDALEGPQGKKQPSSGRSLTSLAVPARATRSRTKGHAVKTTTLKIEGMHCDGCAQTLQFLLGREAGVRKVDVSFAESEARILHDPSACDEKRLAAVVKKAGFRVAGNR